MSDVKSASFRNTEVKRIYITSGTQAPIQIFYKEDLSRKSAGLSQIAAVERGKMEFILLQPLQTTNAERFNVSLIERKYEITPEEENLILHEAGGPFAGFIVKKILPLSMQGDLLLDECHLSFKLNIYMRYSDKKTAEMQQVTSFYYRYLF